MVSYCDVFFLILGTVIKLNDVIALTSPCPNIFNYEGIPEWDRWYGVITFSSNTELVGLSYKIQLNRPSQLLVAWNGETQSEDNINYSIYDPHHKQRPGESVKSRIMVKYNPSEPVPSLIKLVINGNTICNNNAYSHNVVTTSHSTTRIDPDFEKDNTNDFLSEHINKQTPLSSNTNRHHSTPSSINKNRNPNINSGSSSNSEPYEGYHSSGSNFQEHSSHKDTQNYESDIRTAAFNNNNNRQSSNNQQYPNYDTISVTGSYTQTSQSSVNNFDNGGSVLRNQHQNKNNPNPGANTNNYEGWYDSSQTSSSNQDHNVKGSSVEHFNHPSNKNDYQQPSNSRNPNQQHTNNADDKVGFDQNNEGGITSSLAENRRDSTNYIDYSPIVTTLTMPNVTTRTQNAHVDKLVQIIRNKLTSDTSLGGSNEQPPVIVVLAPSRSNFQDLKTANKAISSSSSTTPKNNSSHTFTNAPPTKAKNSGSTTNPKHTTHHNRQNH